MNSLAEALISELDDEALDALAAKLRSRLLPAGGDNDEWIRGAKAIAAHCKAPTSRIYALSSAKRCPPLRHDGAMLIARRSELDRWLENGGGKRP